MRHRDKEMMARGTDSNVVKAVLGEGLEGEVEENEKAKLKHVPWVFREIVAGNGWVALTQLFSMQTFRWFISAFGMSFAGA